MPRLLPPLISPFLLLPRVGPPPAPEDASRAPPPRHALSLAFRRNWLWGLAGGLLAFEALALAVVCLWQIRVAEVRQNEARLREARYLQCLQEMPGASFARCRRRAASSP